MTPNSNNYTFLFETCAQSWNLYRPLIGSAELNNIYQQRKDEEPHSWKLYICTLGVLNHTISIFRGGLKKHNLTKGSCILVTPLIGSAEPNNIYQQSKVEEIQPQSWKRCISLGSSYHYPFNWECYCTHESISI